VDPYVPKSGVFFYLDAHWEAHLPLRDELRIIAINWKDALILIDDFCVDDDPGYGYDDYGPMGSLTLDYIDIPELAGYVRLFPAVESAAETGSRRGAVLLVGPERANALCSAAGLRRAPTFR
jgi:hypothetical protein